VSEIAKMLPLARSHCTFESYEKSAELEYWTNLIGLLRHYLERASEGQEKLEPEY
jgi:hypothetical protein